MKFIKTLSGEELVNSRYVLNIRICQNVDEDHEVRAFFDIDDPRDFVILEVFSDIEEARYFLRKLYLDINK